MPEIPDIVKNARLETEFHAGHTRHIQHQSGNTLDERRKVTEEKWKKERELGYGAFGAVWLERKLGNGSDANELRAVKTLPKKGNINMYRELEAIALFSHQKYRACFVESFGWYEDEEKIFIAMEYLPSGDLQKYLVGPFPEPEVQGIVFQLVEGLKCMHENHFTHRDLKPANILVKCHGPAWWVKIADFGISKRSVGNQTALRTMAGTPAYIAPEVFGLTAVEDEENPEPYTNAVDIWSLGVICFQLLTKTIVFADMRDLAKYALGMTELPTQLLADYRVSERAQGFISKTMSPKPEERAAAIDLLDHPWIASLSNTPDDGYETIAEHGEACVALPLRVNHVSDGDYDQSETLVNTPGDVQRPDSGTGTELPGLRIESARDLHIKGVAQLKRKEYVLAESTFQNAISIFDKLIGHDQEETAHSILAVGRATFRQGKFAASEESFVEATRIFSTLLGREHVHTALSLYSTGIVYFAQTRPIGAEMHFEESFVMRQKVLRSDDDVTMKTVSSYVHAEKYAQAEKCFQEAFDLWKKIIGRHQELTLMALFQLGACQFAQHKYREAEASYRDLATGYESTCGLENDKTAHAFSWLGRARFMLYEFAEAEEALQEAVDIRIKVRGLYDEQTASDCHYLGRAQFEQKNFTLATQSLTDAYTVRKKLCGEDSDDTRASEKWLAKARKARRFRLFNGGK